MSSSSEPAVVLYRYDSSPFTHKIDNVLSLKRIPYEKVDVSPMLPRPEITDQLGIVYRRIPILAIGNDVYCDTSLIVSALERRFTPSNGHRTLFPPTKNGGSTNTGLIKAFAKYYAESTLFPPATNLLPWDKVPATFLKDRSEFAGSPINPKALAGNVPAAQSVISSHLLLVEEQLSDSREWLFDTETPSLADVSVHFVFNWARSFKGTEQLFDAKRIPFTIQWLDRLSNEIKKERQSQPPPTKLTGLDASAKIVAATHEPYGTVGFDTIEASRLRVALGDTVRVAPEDTARNYPTIGKLVALNRAEIILEVRGTAGLIRCHFPRLGFSIRRSAENKL